MSTRTKQTPPELILIVEPQRRIQIRDGRVIAGVDVEALTNLLNSEQASMESLFGIPDDAQPPVVMAGEQPVDLSTFYKITAPAPRVEHLARRLGELSIAQAAYLKPPADLPASKNHERRSRKSSAREDTDDFTGFQEYLGAAADGGINAKFAWDIEGGRGAGISIIDIEGGWNFSHEDLVENPNACIGGVSVSIPKWRTHGTAVLGMLAGDHNRVGINGICPAARVQTVSIFDNPQGNPSLQWGSSKAIKFAADNLSAGDIILIELHRAGPAVDFEENRTQEGYIPIEWWPCDMAAILYATSRNILVVAAAGNGQQNLGADIYDRNPAFPPGPFPPWWSNPFRRNPIDTRSILVGGGVPPRGTHGSRLGPDRSRAEHSNFGLVVDTQGWSDEVATCGGNNDLNPTVANENRHYTRRFHGTSSAAAMVTGVLGCLQGVLRVKQKRLTPQEARAVLRDTSLNSPQQDGPFGPAHLEPIGPRPDLRRLINQF